MSDAEALTFAADRLAALLLAFADKDQTSEARLALVTVALMLDFQYDLPTKQ